MKTKLLFTIIIFLALFVYSSCQRIQTCTCLTIVDGQVPLITEESVQGNKKARQTQCNNVKIEHDKYVAKWITYHNELSKCEIK